MSVQPSSEATTDRRTIAIVLEDWPAPVANAVETFFEHLHTTAAEKLAGFVLSPDSLDEEWLLGAWTRESCPGDSVVRRYLAARSAMADGVEAEMEETQPMKGAPEATLTVRGDAWLVKCLQTLAIGRGLTVVDHDRVSA